MIFPQSQYGSQGHLTSIFNTVSLFYDGKTVSGLVISKYTHQHDNLVDVYSVYIYVVPPVNLLVELQRKLSKEFEGCI